MRSPVTGAGRLQARRRERRADLRRRRRPSRPRRPLRLRRAMQLRSLPPRPPPQHKPLESLPPDATAVQQYCFNTADPAADARFAWQAKKISDMEAELEKRVALLETKTEEFKIVARATRRVLEEGAGEARRLLHAHASRCGRAPARGHGRGDGGGRADEDRCQGGKRRHERDGSGTCGEDRRDHLGGGRRSAPEAPASHRPMERLLQNLRPKAARRRPPERRQTAARQRRKDGSHEAPHHVVADATGHRGQRLRHGSARHQSRARTDRGRLGTARGQGAGAERADAAAHLQAGQFDLAGRQRRSFPRSAGRTRSATSSRSRSRSTTRPNSTTTRNGRVTRNQLSSPN